MQLLLQLALPLLGLVDLLLLLLVELLLLLEALLDPHPQLVLVLGLFVADLVGLRAFEVIPHVLRAAELPSHLDLLLDLLGLVLDLDGGLIVVDSCQAYIAPLLPFLLI